MLFLSSLPSERKKEIGQNNVLDFLCYPQLYLCITKHLIDIITSQDESYVRVFVSLLTDCSISLINVFIYSD